MGKSAVLALALLAFAANASAQVSAKVGSITQPGSTGNQSTTGVGFTPKVVIFFGTHGTADGSGANAVFMIGAMTASNTRVGFGDLKDGLTGSGVGESVLSERDDAVISMVATANSATVLARAVSVSMDADGFTINWTTTDATARIFGYLALAGASLTNAYTGTIIAQGSTGNQAITGVGFQPDMVMMLGMSRQAPLPVDAGPPAANNTNIAFATSSSNRASAVIRYLTNSATSESVGGQRTDKFIQVLNTATINQEADFVSMDSDGFTVNWSTAGSNQRRHIFLAMKGPLFKVFSFNQATSTGNQSVTGLGQTPAAIILTSFNHTSTTSLVNPGLNSFGVGVSSSQRASVWNGLENGSGTPLAKYNLDRAKVIKMMTLGSTPSVDAAADMVSLDTDGFTVDWTTADGTAREIIGLAIGTAASGGSGAKPAQINNPIRGGGWLALALSFSLLVAVKGRGRL